MNVAGIVVILELIGSAAFAVSGVMVAKEKHMDIFGAIVLGCVTAVGGGVIRDLLLGNTPPLMFTDPKYVLCAFVVSLLVFMAARKPQNDLKRYRKETNYILNVTDSLGLAVFVVTGCETALQAGYGSNMFLCMFVGTITGIGGGMLRDMIAGQMPLIMRERVYGVAALSGAAVYMLCAGRIPSAAAGLVSMILTLLIRYLAIRYSWHLPRFYE